MIRLAQFKCNVKAQVINDELDVFFIKQAIFIADTDGYGLTTDEITSSLKLNCPIAIILPYNIKNIIDELVSEKILSKIGENRFILSEQEIKIIKASESVFQKTRDDFARCLHENIEKKTSKYYPPEGLLLLFEAFFIALLLDHGHQLASHFVSLKQAPDKDGMFQIPNIYDIALRTIQSFENDEYKDLPPEFLVDILEMPREYLEYLTSLSRLFIFIQIKNADPDIINFEIKQFMNHEFYLDTNIIIPLLCTSNPHHNYAIRLIQMASLFQIQLKYTQLTKEEFIRKLDGANALMKGFSKKFKRLQEILKNVDEVFIHDFGHNEKDLSKWPGYYLSMKNKLDNLSNLYSIQLVKKDHAIFKDENFQTMKECIRRAMAKDPMVQEHDAYHILLIKRIRNNDDGQSIIGSKYWFITDDSSLKNAELDYGDACKHHSSIQIEKILSILDEYEYISGNETKEPIGYFIELIDSSVKASIPTIRVQDIIDTMDEWIDYEGYTTESIIDMYSDKAFKTGLDKVRKSKEMSEKEYAMNLMVNELTRKLTALQNQLQALIDTATNKDEIINDLTSKQLDVQKQIESLNQTINDLNKQIKSIEDKNLSSKPLVKPRVKKKSIKGAVIGSVISLLIHIIVGLLLGIYSNWTNYDIITYLSITFFASCTFIAWLHSKNRV